MTAAAAISHNPRAPGVAPFDMAQRYVSQPDLRPTLDNLEPGRACIAAPEWN